MLFKRRSAPTLAERIQVMLWPRRSFERSLKYLVLRMLRVPATPHQLALGCAIGIFAAITPLVGAQMLLAGLLAIVMKASFAAAMIATIFGNPVTWAVVWPATYSTGAFLLGRPAGLGDISLQAELTRFGDAIHQLSPDMITAALAVIWPIWEPMLIGTIPVGLFIAGVFYYLSKRAAVIHQTRRRNRSVGSSAYPLGHLVACYDPAQT